MKTKNLNVGSREILLRDREATLAQLIAEVETLRELVRLEEMKLSTKVRKKVDQPEVPILAGSKCGRTSAPRLPQALQTNRG